MRSHTLFGLLFLWIATSATSPGARAQNVQFDVQPAEHSVYVGMPFIVVAKVERANDGIDSDPPVFDATDDFEIEGPDVSRGSFSSSTLVNGVLTREVKHQAVYQYTFTALNDGTLMIPSATITIDGQRHRSNPEQILASRAPAADFATLTLSPGKVTAFVGQAVPIELRFESSRSPSRVTLTADHLPNGVIATPGPRKPLPGDDAPPLRIFGAEGNAFKDLGHPGLAFTEPLILIPERAGEFDVGPVAFMVDFNTRPPQRNIVQADPLRLSVRPLPTNGQPPQFNGIVGPCTIEAMISNATARVGDPLTLTIRMTADLPPDRVPAPLIDLQANVAEKFHLASEGWIDAGINGSSRIYSMTIRPREAGITELPPIHVHWFDPLTEEYRISSSRSLPVKVESSREVTAADAIGRTRTTTPKESLTDSAARVRANRTSAGRLVNFAPDVSHAWSSAWRPIVLLVPPCVWTIVAGGAALLRRRDPSRVRRDRLVRRSLAFARRARQDPSRAGLAARSFVAAHAGMSPDAVTSADALQLRLDPADPDAGVLLAALHATEASDYHWQPPPHASSDLRGSLRRLNRILAAGTGSTR